MAASPNRFDVARLSPVCDVHFAGFSSDTYRLQREGWQIATREDPIHGSITLLLNHREYGIQAVARSIGEFYAAEFHMSHRHGPWGMAPAFNVVKLASEMKVRVEVMRSIGHHMNLQFDDFKLADMTPQTVHVHEYEIGKLPLFAEAKKPLAEQIIVPQRDISDLLAEIRSRQVADIAEIREREKRRELQTIQHASILALAA